MNSIVWLISLGIWSYNLYRIKQLKSIPIELGLDKFTLIILSCLMIALSIYEIIGAFI